MNTLSLPDELTLDQQSAVQVFDYNNSQELSRQQIILNNNTISFLVEGYKEVVFDNAPLSVDSSKFVLMKPGKCLMTERLSNVHHYRSILLFFSNEALLNFIRKNDIEIVAPHTQRSVFSFQYDAFTKRFTDSLIDISALSKSVQSKLLEVKLEEILLYLTEIYGNEFLFALAYNNNDTAQQFIQTIESNLLSKLTLKELAFLCGMSISTFKRKFEQHYAISPIKWFQNKRLEHAHFLMEHERKSASEIYFEIGYENLSSFIQAYKGKFGTTPKQHHKN